MCSDCGKCICGKPEDNNCAHYLSNYMIKNGLISKKPSGSTYNCSSGRPLRAKDMRTIYGNMGKSKHYNQPSVDSYIYCENSGQGHVYYGKKNSATHGWTWSSATYFEYWY